MTDDRCLNEIRDLQAALLMLLDSEMDPSVMAEASLQLLAQAHAHELPGIALPALQWMLERHIDEVVEERDGFGDPVERRLLQMHGRLETTCRWCLLPLPAISTIRRWQRERALAAVWRDWLKTRGAYTEDLHDPLTLIQVPLGNGTTVRRSFEEPALGDAQ
jgi:hypothetical protein